MKKIDWSKHLFRASSFGNMMAGVKTISESQLRRIDELEAKKKEVKGLGKGDTDILEKYKKLETPNDKQKAKIVELEAKKIKKTELTPIQEKELNDNIYLRDNFLKTLSLSKGAKTYLRTIFREIKYNRRKELKSKYIDKGNKEEENAITFLSIYHDQEFENNKRRLEDEFFTGETDVVDGWDTKCAYEMSTLPDKKEPLIIIYEYQDRVYCRLNDSDWWITASILLNMPDEMIVDMFYKEGFNPRWKGGTVPNWKKLEMLNLYIYDKENFLRLCKLHECDPNLKEYEQQLKDNKVDKDLEKACNIFTGFVEMPMKARIVEKKVERDLDVESAMVEMAKLGRIYLQELEDEDY